MRLCRNCTSYDDSASGKGLCDIVGIVFRKLEHSLCSLAQSFALEAGRTPLMAAARFGYLEVWVGHHGTCATVACSKRLCGKSGVQASAGPWCRPPCKNGRTAALLQESACIASPRHPMGWTSANIGK